MSSKTGEAVIGRRVMVDRRVFSWRTLVCGLLWSRRRNFRRDEDAGIPFSDWYHPWLFFLAVGTMLMSCLDAFLTLRLLDQGMYEANPVMAAFLEQGVASFALSKVFLTGTGILILVYLARVRFLNFLRTGLFLTLFFSLYASLVCYEFVNLLRYL